LVELADGFQRHFVRSGANSREVSAAGYRQLAEFRFRIRQYLRFSEEAARSGRIEPQQHQLLLAIKGLPEGTRPTVSALSHRLCLRPHSTVELVDGSWNKERFLDGTTSRTGEKCSLNCMTGGAFGSLIAQFFHFTSMERRTLLVAGASAGMSATFAAPLASILIGVELLLFEWKPRSAMM
jgi:hypothetical protein